MQCRDIFLSFLQLASQGNAAIGLQPAVDGLKPLLCISPGNLLYNGVQQAEILCTPRYNMDRTSS
jgi:hypothetical protein